MIEGSLRYGIVALARSDRRLMEATLQSIARLSGNPVLQATWTATGSMC